MDTTTVLTLADLSDPAPPPGPADWNEAGVAIYPRAIPRDLMHAYTTEWRIRNGFRGIDGNGILSADSPGGYADCAYLRHPALFDLVTCGPLAAAVTGLLGEAAGVHLCLSGWTSTLRDFHQDGYLSPAHVEDAYAAAWIALGDIDPDSGPFQYVPGSHRWHRLTREKIGAHVDLTDPAWPKHTETFLSPLVEAEIEARGAEVVTYLPKRGDLLVWHPRLYHRGSAPKIPGAYRPALIAHLTANSRGQDFPHRPRRAPGGGWFYPGLG